MMREGRASKQVDLYKWCCDGIKGGNNDERRKILEEIQGLGYTYAANASRNQLKFTPLDCFLEG
jgi:hypothetical protein